MYVVFCIYPCFHLKIFQHKIWSALENDPVFQRPLGAENVEDTRRDCFRRTRRLFEYDFLRDDVLFGNPMRASAFTTAVGMYDWSLTARYMLDWEVNNANFIEIFHNDT